MNLPPNNDLLNTPHVQKLCELNLDFQLKNERGFLSSLYKLQNRVDLQVKNKVKKHSKSNTFVIEIAKTQLQYWQYALQIFYGI